MLGFYFRIEIDVEIKCTERYNFWSIMYNVTVKVGFFFGADDVRILVPKGFEVIGALIVKSCFEC